MLSVCGLTTQGSRPEGTRGDGLPVCRARVRLRARARRSGRVATDLRAEIFAGWVHSHPFSLLLPSVQPPEA